MTDDAVYVMDGSWRPDFVVFDLSESDVLISDVVINKEISRQFFAYMQESSDYRNMEEIENLVIFAKQ